MTKPSPAVVDLAALPAVPCPCGWSRRAFADVPGSPVSVHRVEIVTDARTHFHTRLTEVYYFLECEPGAAMELDGATVPVRPGVSVLIPPGTRHRAVGRMTVLVVSSPPFDPADEWEADGVPAAAAV
jgi:mannose-6-phosphate isomerase-like protein (cupin superfamily)